MTTAGCRATWHVAQQLNSLSHTHHLTTHLLYAVPATLRHTNHRNVSAVAVRYRRVQNTVLTHSLVDYIVYSHMCLACMLGCAGGSAWVWCSFRGGCWVDAQWMCTAAHACLRDKLAVCRLQRRGYAS